MNMQIQPVRTPAEMALIDAFGERLSLLPGNGEVVLKRDAAIEALKAGLPTRRIESWHYTDLRRLLTTVPAYDDSAKAVAVKPLVAGSPVLALLNGVAAQKASIEGVTVAPVSAKLADGTYAPGVYANVIITATDARGQSSTTSLPLHVASSDNDAPVFQLSSIAPPDEGNGNMATITCSLANTNTPACQGSFASALITGI